MDNPFNPDPFSPSAAKAWKKLVFKCEGNRTVRVSRRETHQNGFFSESHQTNVHKPGTYMMNSGFLLPGFPCMGTCISYALGNHTENLPTFVVLPDPRGTPYNQQGCFSAGFLPAVHEGLVLNATAKVPIPDLFPHPSFEFAQGESERDSQTLLKWLNEQYGPNQSEDSRLDARIAGYELAA